MTYENKRETCANRHIVGYSNFDIWILLTIAVCWRDF